MELPKKLSFSFQVTEVHDEGLEVSFMHDEGHNFYVQPEIDDISFPVYSDEVVRLENPQAHTRNRKFGYLFKGDVKSAVLAVLASKVKEKQ